ncbi:class II 3-deoxy-7-phosphoheptulonate synthase [Rhodohalobacter sp.]|uniref:class II 3-deoxy-7-phosphoheptulonate synthase n=1 Tax=Rhodohalobacter sp. TaxID=1974210 RepID=UPI002ACD25CE|nr:3-deoxy-7-phosphoheptulonate synthase class II [Rhodohalobacter sp.]MDZ7755569.1 3-deoxy-7-phosphoheptulonate synthase class II [Rhodohalobacter sp.]
MKQKAKEANPINTESLNSDRSWSPLSWSEKPINQLPPYPDTANLERAYNELKSLPPLITSWEIEALKSKLADVSQGKGFLLQGGDCAETFDACTAPKIVNMLKVMLQMSFILVHEMGTPIVRVGRIAGQYAKPRSKDSETIDGVEMLNYRGDLINSFEPNKEARTPDPQRLIRAYEKAALTLNFLRALADEGFADLQHPEQWELDFMQNNEYYKDYEAMVASINKAINFMETITPNSFNTLHKVDIYTSHEALNLYYDSAQTRQVPRKPGFFNLSGHMVWLGNRTKQLDGAHVEYLSGIRNPIGIKVGPPFDMDETMGIIDKLNPNHEAGKIVLITRMGTDEVEKSLPKFIQKIKHSGHPVVWSCDPMHGNTFATDSNVKTRRFNDILEEIKSTFAVHRAEGSYLGGVHLELTGDNVTECVGGANGLNEAGLGTNYETYCDPRLNYEQSLEMAFLVAKEWNKSYRS